MRFIHISDLHIGKTLHHYSLKEEQEDILKKIILTAEDEKVDAVLISGDVYDRAVPSAEAVTAFDDFLTGLSDRCRETAIIVIAGNHDSGERLNYAAGLLKNQNIYLSGKPPQSENELLKKVSLRDEHGDVNFYLMPFFKPSYVKKAVGAEGLSYSDAFKALIEREHIDFKKDRNVLLSHQFFTASGREPETSDSETISVGGLDRINISPAMEFDYAALGHIHKGQQVGAEYIRYCGTPLKYSVSEANQSKSMLLVTLKNKEAGARIREIPLTPIRDINVKTGTLDEILSSAQASDTDEYISITLTDENVLYKPKEKLENVYSRILEMRVDNTRTRERLKGLNAEQQIHNPEEMFNEFFKDVWGRDMSDEEIRVMNKAFKEIEVE